MKIVISDFDNYFDNMCKKYGYWWSEKLELPDGIQAQASCCGKVQKVESLNEQKGYYKREIEYLYYEMD